MQRVVFDSSFLMAVVQRPTSWLDDARGFLGGFEPVILECVLSELRRIAEEGERRARYAALAMKLAEGFRLERCGGASVDDEIVSFAASSGAVVATVDREMIDRLMSLKIRGVTLKSGRVALV